MYRHVSAALVMSVMSIVTAAAEPLSLTPQRQAQYTGQSASPGYIVPQSDRAVAQPERQPPVLQR